ncbi:MAG: hypothetical protein ACKVQU_11270 [Burkholderiales bacterium]
MRPIIAASILAAALTPSVALAQGSWALDVNAGTLGVGAGLGIGLTERFTARVFIAGGNLSRDFSSSGVDYKARLQLRNAPILLDWHPGGSVFRLSAGVVFNDDKLKVDAKPSSAATYTFNGVTYTAASVGAADGTIKFNRAAPYLGIGFGRAVARDSGWNFAMDIGAAYLSKAKASLNVSCGAVLTGAQCAQLQSDASAEAAQLSDDLKTYRWYPVIQAHVTYAF